MLFVILCIILLIIVPIIYQLYSILIFLWGLAVLSMIFLYISTKRYKDISKIVSVNVKFMIIGAIIMFFMIFIFLNQRLPLIKDFNSNSITIGLSGHEDKIRIEDTRKIEELIDILNDYHVKRSPYTVKNIHYNDVKYEIITSDINGPKHILLGETSYSYSSSGEIKYNIQKDEQLIYELNTLFNEWEIKS